MDKELEMRRRIGQPVPAAAQAVGSEEDLKAALTMDTGEAPVEPSMREKLQQYFGLAGMPSEQERMAQANQVAESNRLGALFSEAFDRREDKGKTGLGNMYRGQLAEALGQKKAAQGQLDRRQMIMEKLLGEGAAREFFPEEPKDKSMTEYQKTITDIQKEQNRLRKAELEATKKRKAAEKAEKKAAEKAKAVAKAAEEEAAVAVPGYERTGKVKPRPGDAAKLREVTAAGEDAVAKIKQLDALVEAHGTELYGETSGDMASLHSDILIQLKELAKLGALTGPDVDIITDQLPNPATFGATARSSSSIRAQYKRAIQSAEEKMKGQMGKWGYKKEVTPKNQEKALKGFDINALSPKERQAYDWAMNPQSKGWSGDKAAAIMKKLGVQ